MHRAFVGIPSSRTTVPPHLPRPPASTAPATVATAPPPPQLDPLPPLRSGGQLAPTDPLTATRWLRSWPPLMTSSTWAGGC